jgi:tRNA pseudouridine13 synthase
VSDPADRRSPVRPVRRGGPAPAVRARYKQAPEEFVVDELPLYEPSGAGTHSWLWVEKNGLTTLDAIARLGAALGRRQREFGYAGMKDAQAVTRQWLSLEHADDARLADVAVDGLRVLRVARHATKLKMGHLRGNRFAIRLRDVDAAGAQALRANLADLAARGAPNWFGAQRFGHRGRNVEKGLRILGGDVRRAGRTMPRRLLMLLLSAVQSEVFNRVLLERLATCDQVLAGDVAWLHRNGACFVVRDLATDQKRCARFEISPSGPLPGPDALRAEGEPAELEARALASLELDPQAFAKVPFGMNQGARRPLRVKVEDPQVTEDAGGVWVSFALDRGAYATSVLHELLEDAPWVEEN